MAIRKANSAFPRQRKFVSYIAQLGPDHLAVKDHKSPQWIPNELAALGAGPNSSQFLPDSKSPMNFLEGPLEVRWRLLA